MNLDDHLCLCFHVSRRKIQNFMAREQPKVASQLSGCGGAGTGCGWCIPFLKQMFKQATESGAIESMTAEEYAAKRASYVRSGGGVPPPGATPLSAEESIN